MSTPDVDLWIASCDGGATLDLHAMLPQLSEDERRRADSMLERPRTQFIVARHTWRVLLARYLGTTASAVRFEYGPFGQPVIAAGTSEAPLHSSLSHSASLVAIAVARVKVGVDVEEPIAPDRVPEIVRYLSSHERQALSEQEPAQRPQAVLRCWTRKEAYAKAVGMGLSLPFDAFDVSVGPAASLMATSLPGDRADGWTLWTKQLAGGAIVSLAARARSARVRECADWSFRTQPA